MKNLRILISALFVLWSFSAWAEPPSFELLKSDQPVKGIKALHSDFQSGAVRNVDQFQAFLLLLAAFEKDPKVSWAQLDETLTLMKASGLTPFNQSLVTSLSSHLKKIRTKKPSFQSAYENITLLNNQVQRGGASTDVSTDMQMKLLAYRLITLRHYQSSPESRDWLFLAGLANINSLYQGEDPIRSYLQACSKKGKSRCKYIKKAKELQSLLNP